MKQFVFGTTQAEWDHQDKYLADHGITYNAANHTYTITSDALDFQYMIQTGNKGTWSTADVDRGCASIRPSARTVPASRSR